MNRSANRQRLHIDGTLGEGGGQILRTALALSMCLGRPFHMTGIRARRRKPGLQPQHLAAVKAAAAISGASLEGAAPGSGELVFIPNAVEPGHYRFATGTAGSTTLILQTLLPALLTADRPSHLELSGGTHNPFAPPFDFIELAFLPLINRMGPHVTATLLQPGFYPAGGGRIQVDIEPVRQLQGLKLQERGSIIELTACATVSHLPLHIAQRELQVIGAGLGLQEENLRIHELTSAKGPGNVVSVMVRCRHITELFTGFGLRGVRAEHVAAQVVDQVQRYLAAGIPVGAHLADQLLLPMTLAGGGSFLTLRPTLHTTTNIAVLQKFLTLHADCRKLGPDRWCIELH